MKITEVIQNFKSWYIQRYRGQPIFDVISFFYDTINYPAWRFDKRGIMSREKLGKYKDKYLDKRCFILGNGPSLKKTNLKLLKKEYTFGLNRVYLMFDELGFTTTFLVSINNLVLNQSNRELQDVNTTKFISWKGRKYFRNNKNIVYIRTLVREIFSHDPTQGVWEGATVTYVAMQLAFYLGFQKVYLIGVDHGFKTKGKPHSEIVTEGKDKDHFQSNYFGQGYKWHLPDLKTSEYAYRLAKKAFEKKGREILDATIGGKLKVFKKVNYKSLFSGN